MMLRIRSLTRHAVLLTLAFHLATGLTDLAAAESPAASADKQRELISVLQSDAPPQEKAITCKKLAVYGNKEAVPALAALLSDTNLASWARIALEVIPDPAADAALRDALGKLQGNLLIGVVNSIGVRRDATAVPGLLEKLNASDAVLAAAAAEALGHIGGPPVAKALAQFLADAPEASRSSVALGCVMCAEKFLREGNSAEATRLYDAVRQANVPKQRVLEATRGAILARQSAGIPLLLEQLRSADKALFGIGLRTARELPGPEVTDALVAELDRASADRQVFLLLAVADRTDAAVAPKIMQAAQRGPKQVRTIALGMLDRFGDLACVPVLLNAAVEGDADLTRTAKATLARLEGKPVDADLAARLSQATGKTRQVLLELAAQRRIEGALPGIMRSVDDADPAVRHTAWETLGVLGNAPQATELIRLLPKAQTPRDREDIEKALVAICGRCGAPCLPHVLPLAKSDDASVRRVALRALASIGGSEALAAVKTAADDQDEAVQDEAVGILCGWPNTWPEDTGVAEPLLALAKSGRKPSYQVQGARGYLHYVQEDKKLSTTEKLARVTALLPVLKRPDEKRLAIAVVSAFPTGGALELLMTFTDDDALTEEACLAIVKIAADKGLKDASKELRQKALQTVADKSKSDSTRNKAREALNKLQ